MEKQVKDGNERTPSQLKIPAYLVNFPFSMSIDNPNNVFMKKNKEPLDKDRAYGQFMQLYNFLASQGLVMVLPTTEEFQDLPYVANIGMYLPHDDKQTFVLSNFTSPPRQGEEDIADAFFRLMRYETIRCPYKWEGEAELKWLHDNVYIGGYGMRSDIRAFHWFEKQFRMKVIKVKMTSEEQYHLDCSVFPLSTKKTLLFVDNYTKEEIKEIEKETEIIPVPKEIYCMDPTNVVLFYNMLLTTNSITEMKKTDEEYFPELAKLQFLERVCAENGLDLVTFNLSEFGKAGASLSCQVLNLNFHSYKIPLL